MARENFLLKCRVKKLERNFEKLAEVAVVEVTRNNERMSELTGLLANRKTKSSIAVNRCSMVANRFRTTSANTAVQETKLDFAETLFASA
jgi:hypothetical protein